MQGRLLQAVLPQLMRNRLPSGSSGSGSSRLGGRGRGQAHSHRRQHSRRRRRQLAPRSPRQLERGMQPSRSCSSSRRQ